MSVFSAFANASVGEGLVKCANSYIGMPYDTNPLGEYVQRKLIVYDESMDCMYMVFRCSEIALGKKRGELPEQIALKMRFHSKGVLDESGFVVNYDDRFQYGEDMVLSPKWGRNVTKEIGKVSLIAKTSRTPAMEYVMVRDIELSKFESGDIVFLVKHVNRRIGDEIVGHLGFVEVRGGKVYMVHARGLKKRGNAGGVQKIELLTYLESTRNKFVGVMVKRL